MIAPGLDFGVEFKQAALEDGGGVALGTVEDGEDVFQFQAGVAVSADLLEAKEVPVAVAAIVARTPACGLEQADGFVIKKRAAAKAAAPRKYRDRQHQVPL